MRARELIQRLEDAGLDSEVRIRIIVGGDLVTDDVELVAAHDHSDAHGTYLVLEPDDLYDVRALIDEALEARAAREALEAARHCHADGVGPCLAADCPLPLGTGRAARCPGVPGPQHPAAPRARLPAEQPSSP